MQTERADLDSGISNANSTKQYKRVQPYNPKQISDTFSNRNFNNCLIVTGNQYVITRIFLFNLALFNYARLFNFYIIITHLHYLLRKVLKRIQGLFLSALVCLTGTR